MAAGEERRKQVVRARIARVRRRLNTEVLLKAAVVPAWIAACAFVGWRLLVHRGVGIVGGVLFVAALVTTWLYARRRTVSEDEAAIVADRRASAGGLLLTRLERAVGEWELGLNQRLHDLALPSIEVKRPLALLALAVLFVAAGLLVPLPERLVHPTNAAAQTRVERLDDKVTALAKEEPPDQAALDELQRLKEEVEDGTFDAADWEAADALDKQLAREAAEAAAELARAENAAKDLEEAMAHAQSGESAQRERDELERALMELSDGQAASGEQAMQQAMGQQGEGQSGQNGENGQQGDGKNGDGTNGDGQQSDGKNGQQGQQGQNGQRGDGENGQQGQQGQNGQQGDGKNGQGSNQKGPSRAQVSELKNALQQRREQLAKSFGQKSGSSGQQASRPSGQSQQGQGQQGQQGQGKGQQGKGQSGDGQSGSGQSGNGSQGKGNGDEHASRNVEEGSPARGGGANELVFGGEAEMDPDRLKFDALPEGNGGEAGDLFGLRAANPKANPNVPDGVVSGSAAVGDQGAGYSEGAMRPRNRALVQKYFDSK